jgi:hypothetical protein
MKNRLMPIMDRLMLRKRSIIGDVNDQLKNISQIEHSRHRSPVNFFPTIVAGPAACRLKPERSSIGINFIPQELLTLNLIQN